MARRSQPKGAARPTRVSASRPSKAPPKLGALYSGVFQSVGARGGFVVLDEPALPDFFIPADAAATALHGDRVRVEAIRLHHGRAPEGRVERVLRHANKQIVGQIRRSRKISVVRPKNPKIDRLIEIHRQFKQEEVPDGAWVIVEIRRWSRSRDQPLVGSLAEVLGTEDDERLPILLLVREGGITPDFPPEVDAEAEAIGKRALPAKEIARRRDFRRDRVFTIDPATAKDFDDAVSLVHVSAKGWRVAVHIADVAHFVVPDSAIDAEGYDRATSIYPVDRVIPMLPEALSNHQCSLRPGEDKLVMTAVFDVGRNGEVDNVELCEAVIHSVRRFNYEEVKGLMDRADGVADSPHPAPEVDPALFEDLTEVRRASAALLAARMKRGSLDLDLPETEVEFDDKGRVCNVRRKERLESHRLIEDLMIAANEAVARELTRARLPLLYRIHEPPDPRKLIALGPALARFGLPLPRERDIDCGTLQKLLTKAREHPAGPIVQRWVLRAMQRACYRPDNAGHFGLASESYCHFTSPIRRYPDLVVHRAVKALLGGPAAQRAHRERSTGAIAEWGRHCSSREERSQRIEWDAQKILTFEFMRRHLGDVFEGFITGAMRRGFFVELIRYPAEGFVPAKSIEGDFFDLDEAGVALVGRRSGRTYAVGDRVRVQVERIDVLAGEMDLILVRKEGEASGGARRKGGKGAQDGKGAKRGRKNEKPYDWRKHVKKRR